ncbi:DUF1631 family protein [Caldimonas sp. KR1-144]|uniref:DUF1631 family protein n=1 Tax=Caldimonas sp. KR1-144 TaxID=3400911 RepID=UPI003C112E28
MNSLIAHHTLQAAVQQIEATVVAAAQRLLDHLAQPSAALLAQAPRAVISRAQFDLRLQLGAFSQQFGLTLRESVGQESLPTRTSTRSLASTTFESLSLVDDHAEDERVSAHRLSTDIEHDCEWELRELDSLVGSLLGLGRPDHERNPLRPEAIGRALFRATETVTDDPIERKLLARELGRALAPVMRDCYRAIIADLKTRGVQAAGLAVKTVQGPGNELPREMLREASGYQTSGYAVSARDTQQALHALQSIFGIVSVPAALGSALGAGLGGGAAGSASAPGALRGHGGGTEAHFNDMIRRLAVIGSAAMEAGAARGAATGSGGATPSSAGAFGQASAAGSLGAINMIRAHRDELMRASTGALDNLVIDIVATMFDQVLSDNKVPPQMARQIARLQMPVLRAALKDVGFFSSRKHPVRRFINRIATLAAAYEDFDEGQGKEFLERVRELVQEIIEGEFDQMDLYESKLHALEALVGKHTARDAGPHAAAAAVLDDKETQLRIQQRYMRELKQRLQPVAAPDFVRDFLAQVWSQVLVMATGPRGTQALADRMARVPSELVLSVQPKGEPARRKAFLLALPQLMKDLNEGFALIGWPEAARKDFFAKLLPAHAESLKLAPPTEEAMESLQLQLNDVASVPIPTPLDLAPASAPSELPAPEEHAAPLQFTPEEAQQIGLVEESAIDWDGTVDIDLSEPGGPDSAEVDILLEETAAAEGLPPTRGIGLLEHVQPGVAYRMHLDGKWQRVRLSWVSPGRAFFVFTHGKANQKTVSMTARMLARMCETERFRAYEQAELIERATARARRQLAQLARPAGSSTH